MDQDVFESYKNGSPSLPGTLVSASADELPLVDYRVVGLHNSEQSAYVSYEGIVYDITEFLHHHPGGQSILRAALGTDITETLTSFHEGAVSNLLRTDAYRQRYGIRRVGKLANGSSNKNNRIGHYEYQSRREYTRPDTMGKELREEVFKFLREAKLPVKKPFAHCVGLLGFFYGLYGIGVYMAFFQGSLLWSVLLGPIATFAAVNVAHTVMHEGFSEWRILNLLGRALWDVGGYSSRSWDIEHQTHHQAPHSLIDLQTAPPSLVRFFKHQEFQWFHRYQMFYIWFAFLFFSPKSWATHTYNTLFTYECVQPTEKIVHVLLKTLGFVLPISLSFYWFDFGTALRNLVLFALSVSYFSLFTLFIQHEDSYLPEEERETWSVRQVTTSSTWYTSNFIFEWLLGYFNYHTEHHLFPGFNPALYPKIQPIVRSVCERHGVAYKYISYFELVRSQLRAWRKFSHGPAPILAR